jgi:precorrin-6A/cobalt-precorrin-6A reductase
MRILVLGGTVEASALAAALAGRPEIDAVLSLAGRTGDPRPQPIPTRTGGFGGREGLVQHLTRAGFDAVIDATHPFAARISCNAAEACAELGLPLIALRRPPWTPRAGDRWTEVASMDRAVAALGDEPRRVFLTVGRQELGAFARAPWHRYVARTIEPIGDALPAPGVVAIAGRGPFDEAAERALIECERIEILVTKNSGGAATYPKIAAARALRLPVVIVARPEPPAGVEAMETVAQALGWLERRHGRAPTARGV